MGSHKKRSSIRSISDKKPEKRIKRNSILYPNIKKSTNIKFT